MIGATKRQGEVLVFVKNHLEGVGRPPTLAEIAAHFHWSSVNSAASHIAALRLKGLVKIDRGVARGIRLVKL